MIDKNAEGLTKLTERIAKGIDNLDDFKAELLFFQNAGFDPNYVHKTEGSYNSLLKACLMNPTETNFELFKYLVENNIIKIEDQLSAKTINWDTQNPATNEVKQFAENTSKVIKFLDYIDNNTTNEQKNKCQLFNLSIYFNHVQLFQKLLNNNEITINSPGQRNTTPMSDIFMNPSRPEITKGFIASPRFVEAETGAPRNDIIMQTFYFGDDVIDELLKPDKFPAYSGFNDAIQASFSNVLFTDKRHEDRIIKFYNMSTLDTLAMLKPGLVYQFKIVQPRDTTVQIDVLFLNKPSTIDIVLDIVRDTSKQPPDEIGGREFQKLLYVLKCIRAYKGLDFKRMANDEHKKIFETLNTANASMLGMLLSELAVPASEIEGFCNNVRDLGCPAEVVDKLKASMIEFAKHSTIGEKFEFKSIAEAFKNYKPKDPDQYIEDMFLEKVKALIRQPIEEEKPIEKVQAIPSPTPSPSPSLAALVYNFFANIVKSVGQAISKAFVTEKKVDRVGDWKKKEEPSLENLKEIKNQRLVELQKQKLTGPGVAKEEGTENAKFVDKLKATDETQKKNWKDAVNNQSKAGKER